MSKKQKSQHVLKVRVSSFVQIFKVPSPAHHHARAELSFKIEFKLLKKETSAYENMGHKGVSRSRETLVSVVDRDLPTPMLH